MSFEVVSAMSGAPTIFEETAGDLGRQLREAAVDHEAFERGLSVCDLQSCRATCCHDGAILSEEEAEILSRMDDRSGVVTLDDGRVKTKTEEAAEADMAGGFPDHFSKTRCVYLDDQHRCHWQLKAMEEGRHPWFYKPTSCWMHPILLARREGRPLLTILSREEDKAGFASHTHCGRVDECSRPAREGLSMELEMLELLSGRNFVAELNAPSI